MKRQSHISNHVNVVVLREVDRVKQLLLVKKTIDTIDNATGSIVEKVVFSLPDSVCLWNSAPTVSKSLIKEVLGKDFFDEMSFPLVPSEILPAGETEEFIVIGSVNYDPNDDNNDTTDEKNGLYWLSVQEVYFRLNKQQMYKEKFKEGLFIDVHSGNTLCRLNTMGLLG